MDKFLLFGGRKTDAMKARILIIDDNTDLTSIASLILTSEGFAVQVCHSLSECDSLIENWKPHLLLLDVNVDGEDGRQLCSKFKSQNERSDVKILLMSGDESTLEEEFGADGCIAKPFDTAILVKKINNCLQLKTENT